MSATRELLARVERDVRAATIRLTAAFVSDFPHEAARDVARAMDALDVVRAYLERAQATVEGPRHAEPPAPKRSGIVRRVQTARSES